MFFAERFVNGILTAGPKMADLPEDGPASPGLLSLPCV